MKLLISNTKKIKRIYSRIIRNNLIIHIIYYNTHKHLECKILLITMINES